MNDLILFLDIDGVLNRFQNPEWEEKMCTQERWNGLIGMEPGLIEKLHLIVECTNCKIVISSSWKYKEDTLKALKHFGFKYMDKIIAGTRRVSENGYLITRGEQIKDYCDENNVKRFFVIDDEPLDIDGEKAPEEIRKFFKGKVIKTNMYEGLTDTHVFEAVARYGVDFGTKTLAKVADNSLTAEWKDGEFINSK